MKAVLSQIIKIGNSNGVRIPKALLKASELSGAVEIAARKNQLIIRKARRPREGWEEAAKEMARNGDDKLLDGYVPTAFDKEHWEW